MARGFGTIARLPSGRYRARYRVGGVWVSAPATFRRKADAESWLTDERRRIESHRVGTTAKVKVPTFQAYATRWLGERPLRPSTSRTYRVNLERHANPVLGGIPLDRITPDVIRAWWSALAPGAPTSRARTYAVVRTILGTAVDEDLIAANPCRIRGAGNVVRPATEVHVATPEQVADLRARMPARLAAAIPLGAWCQLRAGEVLALRRRDVDLGAAVVHVRRGVTWTSAGPVFGPPKTQAGLRNVHVPPGIVPVLADHLAEHVGPGADALLFATAEGNPVKLTTFSTAVKAATARTDLPATFRFHHLRHTGLTLLAQGGASIAELMARAGHATAQVALRYSHGTAARDRALAEGLDPLM